MKKYSLSLILVLCLFVITGGVYAAFNYYETSANAQSNSANATIEGATNAGNVGTITFDAKSLTITIDDKGGHVPGATIGGSTVSVTYNDTDSVSKEDLTWVLSSSNGDVIAVNGQENVLQDNQITVAEVQSLITNCNGGKALPTIEDYNAFAKLVTETTLTITITAKPHVA